LRASSAASVGIADWKVNASDVRSTVSVRTPNAWATLLACRASSGFDAEGMITPSTRSLPTARAARPHTTAESIPPERPITNVLAPLSVNRSFNQAETSLASFAAFTVSAVAVLLIDSRLSCLDGKSGS
jgi:hypothetical protein